MENFNHNLGNFLKKLKYPLISEKTVYLNKNNQYTFIVDRSLKKPQIKFIFEKIFNTKILSVKTINLPVKMHSVGKFSGKKPLYKKIYLKFHQKMVESY